MWTDNTGLNLTEFSFNNMLSVLDATPEHRAQSIQRLEDALGMTQGYLIEEAAIEEEANRTEVARTKIILEIDP